MSGWLTLTDHDEVASEVLVRADAIVGIEDGGPLYTSEGVEQTVSLALLGGHTRRVRGTVPAGAGAAADGVPVSETTAVNTWGQLVAAGGGVMLTRPGNPGRNAGTSAWAVIRVTAAGGEVLTDPCGAAWYQHGRRWFHDMVAGDKAASLAAAQAWVAAQGWYDGPWVRNRMGDYLPADIHRRFPLTPRSRRRG